MLSVCLRMSLEDAGFPRLTQLVDLDLCDALNAGYYLLRLSIQSDVSDLDPLTASEMYPALVTSKNGTAAGQRRYLPDASWCIDADILQRRPRDDSCSPSWTTYKRVS